MSLKKYLQDKNLPSVKETMILARRQAIQSNSKNAFEKKRAMTMVQKKKEKKDQLSDSQILVNDKMVQKNMNIKQRAVNETPPMIGTAKVMKP